MLPVESPEPEASPGPNGTSPKPSPSPAAPKPRPVCDDLATCCDDKPLAAVLLPGAGLVNLTTPSGSVVVVGNATAGGNATAAGPAQCSQQLVQCRSEGATLLNLHKEPKWGVPYVLQRLDVAATYAVLPGAPLMMERALRGMGQNGLSKS